MTTFEHDFQLHSPAEPEFQLVAPEPEHAVTLEVAGEQLDFTELFGAVALFAVTRHGHFEIPERMAA